MKKSIWLLVSILTTAAVCYSQEESREVRSGGRKIQSSGIQHSNPVLYPNSNKGFLLVWNDYRNDSLEYYAQLFDSLGNSVEKNFPIFSNTLIAFAPDSSFFTEKYDYVDIGGGFSELDWSGYVCRLDGTWSRSFFDRSSPLYPTDCVGIYCASGGFDLVGSGNCRIDLSGQSGGLSISASDWTNKELWNWRAGYAPQTYVVKYSATFDSEGDFAVAWLNAGINGASLTYDIMGSFFDRNGDTLATNVIIKPDTLPKLDPDWEWWMHERLRIVPVANSLYELFDYDPDSFCLTYWKVDLSGHHVGDVDSLIVYHDTSGENASAQRVTNIALTPLISGKFSVVMTVRESGISSPRYYNSVINFDGDGLPIGTMIEDTTINYYGQKYLFTVSDSILLVPAVEDSDIYLNAYQGRTLKWSKKVNDDILGIEENGSPRPAALTLSQNYPNPFNPTTVISYQLTVNSHVTLKVYDILGREVATLVEGYKTAGYYQTQFDGSRFASGVYFVRLNVGANSATQKIVMIK